MLLGLVLCLMTMCTARAGVISNYKINSRDCSRYFVFDINNEFMTQKYCSYGELFDTRLRSCNLAKRVTCPAASALGKTCRSKTDCVANSGLACISSKCQCASKATRYWSVKMKQCKACPDGWVNRTTTNTCYFVSPNTQVWSVARQWCKAHDSQLAIIKNQYEFNFLIKLTRLQSKYYWIGLTDKTPFKFVWQDGRPASQYELENWFPAGQIQDAYNRGFDGCVNTDSFETGRLNNWNCSDPSNYLCERRMN